MRLGLSLVIIFLFRFVAMANVTGSDIQNFNPTTNGIDFVTVQSSETLDQGVVNLGFFLNYAVNTMPNYENKTTGRRTDFRDSLLGGDLNIGVGVLRNWDVGFSAPQVYAQTSDDKDEVFQGEIAQTGLTEYRANTKYRFFGDMDGGLAVVGTVNIDQVVNNPFVGNDPGPTWNLELVWDTTRRGYNYAVNAGYRFRDPGTQIEGIPIEPFDDQFIYSAAVSYLRADWDTKLIAEIYGAFPIDTPQTTSDREVSSLELLLGAKRDIRHDIALHFGGATELYQGSSSPDWRLYTGVNWNFGLTRGYRENSINIEDVDFSTQETASKERFVAGDVLFEFNSAQLSPKFQEILKQLAIYLNQAAGFKTLEVEGHTDSVGPEEYNMILSEKRANSVKDFLIGEAKLPTAKVKAVGYGETKPIADNGNYQGRAKNRRVEFSIVR